MKTATLLVGLPCSGKSTYVKENNLVSISRDEIVEQLCVGMTYSEAFKSVDQKLVDKIYQEKLDKLLESGIDFCIDKTNISPYARQNTIKYLKSYGYKIKLVVFDVPLEIIRERNIQRNIECGKFIPEEVIDKMNSQFDILSITLDNKNVELIQTT